MKIRSVKVHFDTPSQQFFKGDAMDEQLVVFELNGEAYGVEVACVQGIIPLQPISVVPGAPAFIEGVINLRGAVVPVVDLRTRFGLSLPTNDHKPVIVIVELANLPIGLIVDKVTDVTRMAEAAIEPPSPLLTSVDTTYLRGIGKFKERLVILLDLGRVFSLEEKQTLVETA
jgi:purine-binding chemotaxis protein CheW